MWLLCVGVVAGTILLVLWDVGELFLCLVEHDGELIDEVSVDDLLFGHFSDHLFHYLVDYICQAFGLIFVLLNCWGFAGSVG